MIFYLHPNGDLHDQESTAAGKVLFEKRKDARWTEQVPGHTLVVQFPECHVFVPGQRGYAHRDARVCVIQVSSWIENAKKVIVFDGRVIANISIEGLQ